MTSEEMGILNQGGIFDLFDNMAKLAFRMTDREYDFLCEHATDEELSLSVGGDLTFGEKRQLVEILEKYYKLANESHDKGSI